VVALDQKHAQTASMLGTPKPRRMDYAAFLRRQPDGGQVSADTWHRVGFTWRNSSRKLPVDDVLVAKDA